MILGADRAGPHGGGETGETRTCGRDSSWRHSSWRRPVAGGRRAGGGDRLLVVVRGGRPAADVDEHRRRGQASGVDRAQADRHPRQRDRQGRRGRRPAARTPAAARSRRTSVDGRHHRSGWCSSRPAGSQYELSRAGRRSSATRSRRPTTPPSATRRTGPSRAPTTARAWTRSTRGPARRSASASRPSSTTFANSTGATSYYRLEHHAQPRRRTSSSSPSWQLSNGDTTPPPGARDAHASSAAAATAATTRSRTSAAPACTRCGTRGEHTADGRGYSYNKVFDVDVAVTPQTRALVPDLPRVRARRPRATRARTRPSTSRSPTART